MSLELLALEQRELFIITPSRERGGRGDESRRIPSSGTQAYMEHREGENSAHHPQTAGKSRICGLRGAWLLAINYQLFLAERDEAAKSPEASFLLFTCGGECFSTS